MSVRLLCTIEIYTYITRLLNYAGIAALVMLLSTFLSQPMFDQFFVVHSCHIILFHRLTRSFISSTYNLLKSFITHSLIIFGLAISEDDNITPTRLLRCNINLRKVYLNYKNLNI